MTNMYLAYFTNQYPTVSHSFIRREIITLEEMGNTVERFALRSVGAELVDPLNHSEFNKTSHASSEPKITIILAIFNAALKQPLKFLKTLLLAGKFPQAAGMFKFVSNKLHDRRGTLIEYK